MFFMKKPLSIILCIIMVFCLAACTDGNKESSSSLPADVQSSSEATDSREKFELTAAKAVTSFKDSENVIICWGDSITKGHTLGDGWSYPEQLQGDIGNQFRVINAGVNGEPTYTIMSRAGAIDMVLTNDITFAAGEDTVELDRSLFTTADGNEITYKGDGNELKTNTVIIGGVKYTMSVKEGSAWDQKIYCLTRPSSSSALTVKKGTEAQFDYSAQYSKNYCNIILSGANDNVKTDADLNALIEKQKKIAALSDKYIVIVPFHSSTDYTEAYKEAFGDNALSVREYFQTDAFADYDVEKTKSDERSIEQSNWIPSTFTMTRMDVHLNELGCKVLADKVYEKGVELGYWS